MYVFSYFIYIYISIYYFSTICPPVSDAKMCIEYLKRQTEMIYCRAWILGGSL